MQTEIDFTVKRTWTVWPPDKLQYAKNCIKKLWSKRHNGGAVRDQIRCMIDIIKGINNGTIERLQGNQL